MWFDSYQGVYQILLDYLRRRFNLHIYKMFRATRNEVTMCFGTGATVNTLCVKCKVCDTITISSLKVQVEKKSSHTISHN